MTRTIVKNTAKSPSVLIVSLQKAKTELERKQETQSPLYKEISTAIYRLEKDEDLPNDWRWFL